MAILFCQSNSSTRFFAFFSGKPATFRDKGSYIAEKVLENLSEEYFYFKLYS